MESSGGFKMSVISLALALVAIIVALAFGARKPEQKLPAAVPASDGRVKELDAQVTDLKARLARLEGAPGDVDKSKFVTMDAVLRD